MRVSSNRHSYVNKLKRLETMEKINSIREIINDVSFNELTDNVFINIVDTLIPVDVSDNTVSDNTTIDDNVINDVSNNVINDVSDNETTELFINIPDTLIPIDEKEKPFEFPDIYDDSKLIKHNNPTKESKKPNFRDMVNYIVLRNKFLNK